MRLVKPGNHNDFLAHRYTFKSLRKRRIHLKPSVRRAFSGLPGGFRTLLEGRPNEANWGKGIACL